MAKKNVQETENPPKSIQEQENQKLHVQEITKDNKWKVNASLSSTQIYSLVFAGQI